jgi:hypothetical protein
VPTGFYQLMFATPFDKYYMSAQARGSMSFLYISKLGATILILQSGWNFKAKIVNFCSHICGFVKL